MIKGESKKPKYLGSLWFSGVPVFGEHQNHIIGDFLKFNNE